MLSTISVCIATYRRPQLLSEALAALARQSRPAEEIVISDAGQDTETQRVIREFSLQYAPKGNVIHCPTQRKALPWQRRWAYDHSHGNLILFLDDDIALKPEALANLLAIYRRLDVDKPSGPVAGVGFWLFGYSEQARQLYQPRFKERWLRTVMAAPGSITRGGLTVSYRPTNTKTVAKVSFLSGGAMSYPRRVIEQVGLLESLIELYDRGIGRSEDAVFSSFAAREGSLYLITEPMAAHLEQASVASPYARNGWRKGWTETWTRAHTMRWMASDRNAYFAAWLRTVILELGRGLSGIFRAPGRGASWFRVFGACAGSFASLLNWRRIPPHPRPAEAESRQPSSNFPAISSVKS